MEFVLIWLLFGIVTGIIANSRDRGGCAWFALGFLLGPFGLILVLALPKGTPEKEKAYQGQATMKKCPYCAEEIRIEAIKCKHCGSELAP